MDTVQRTGALSEREARHTRKALALFLKGYDSWRRTRVIEQHPTISEGAIVKQKIEFQSSVHLKQRTDHLLSA